jgi:hypothetical protein
MANAMKLLTAHRSRPLLSLFAPLAVILAGGLLVTGCDAGTVSGASSEAKAAPVSVSFTAGTTSPAAPLAKSSQSFSGPAGNTLVLNSVKMVLREIEFERADAVGGCPAGDDSGSDSEDDCEELESGPVLVSLPLGGGSPSVVVDTTLPVGTWEEAEFEVHRLEPSDSEDSALLADIDFPPNVSIQAEGTYTPAGESAQAFSFTTDLEAEREIAFVPPIEVTADTPKNITFSVDVNAWFRQSDSTLVDPASAASNGPNEGLVESNIETSIEGFEDDDRDGEEEGSEDDDGNNDGDDDHGDDDHGDDDDGDDDHGDDDDDDGDGDTNETEIVASLTSTGVASGAYGEAEYEQEGGVTEFSVEAEGLPIGTYDLVVADTTRGTIDVQAGGNDGPEGEIEFRTPSESGHPALTFDPLGAHVEVTQDGTVYLETDFPTGPGS